QQHRAETPGDRMGLRRGEEGLAPGESPARPDPRPDHAHEGHDQQELDDEEEEGRRRGDLEHRTSRDETEWGPTGHGITPPGDTVPVRKLRQFQALGHTAVVISGDYTALVGDPSGRDKARDRLTEAQVAENAKDYLRQVGRIVDLDRAEVHHNGDWFAKWTFL